MNMNRLLTKIEMLEAMARRHLRRLEPAPKAARVAAELVSANSQAIVRLPGWGRPR
jgi:hypothetical protein